MESNRGHERVYVYSQDKSNASRMLEHYEDVDDDCEYDSTWEDEIKTSGKKKFTSYKSRRNMFAARDMQQFRHSCRELDVTNSGEMPARRDPQRTRATHGYFPGYQAGRQENVQGGFYNLQFYQGIRKSEPEKMYIHDFHQKWWGRYEKLESVHSYIQWLFPIQERGMNWQAHVLTKEEIRLFRKDETVQQNLLKSYELMLDFYGIRLKNKLTGEVARAPNWEDRFGNLNRNTHNNLRITRILKCLGTLGFQHYQFPLVKFFLIETLVENNLPSVKESVLDYFMFAVLNKSERKELVRFAFAIFWPQNMFVWGPKMILQGASKETETRYPPGNEFMASGENRIFHKECSKMQERGGTHSSPNSYTAEGIRSDIKLKTTTGKESSVKGNQAQMQGKLTFDPPGKQTPNEKDDSGQKVKIKSQFSSNGEEEREKKVKGGEATSLTRSNHRPACDGPEKNVIPAERRKSTDMRFGN